MAYVDKDYLLTKMTAKELIRLFADKAAISDPEPSAVDDDILDPIIAEADDLINSYCRRHYTVPFATAPVSVQDAAATIVIYKGYLRRGSVSQFRKDDYDSAIKWLVKISEGKADVGGEPQPTAADGRVVSLTGATRVMTESRLSGL